MWVSPQAQQTFLASVAAQGEWRQIHHLCYWELMWSYSFQQDWREAYRYADLLCKESKWSQVQYMCNIRVSLSSVLFLKADAASSQATYVFQKAAILSMLPEEEVDKLGENVVELFRCVEVVSHCRSVVTVFMDRLTGRHVLCRQVDGLRLRIAGKSVPTEKFAAKKAERYVLSNPVKLAVPALVRTCAQFCSLNKLHYKKCFVVTGNYVCVGRLQCSWQKT